MAGRIDVINTHGVDVLVLTGEHDLATEPSVADALEQSFAHGSQVIVDLTDAEFIDSSVLRALLRGFDYAERKGEDAFSIVLAPGTFPERVLDLVKISPVVPTFATRAEALRAFGVGF